MFTRPNTCIATPTVATVFGVVMVSVLFGHTTPYGTAAGGDWPQVLGPTRNGQAAEESVAVWQAELPTAWNYECGAGYAGVAVADGKVFVWHREEDQEILDCLDTSNGRRVWRQAFEAYYRGGVDPDVGPRCVPVAFGDYVIVYGASGDLHAVSISSGKKLWSRELKADYNADDGYFGAGSTPLIIAADDLANSNSSKLTVEVAEPRDKEDLVIVEVGGRKGAGLVAVELANGKTRWQALSSEAAYASPVKLTLEGEIYIAALMRLSLAIVDPKTGAVLQEIPFGRRGPTVNAATPLVEGQQIFLTASYGIGCKKLMVSSKGYQSLWRDDAVISSQYVTPVKVGDYLFAITGREDMGVPGLCCVDWNSGEQQWIEAGYGTGHPIAVDDRVLIQNVDGRLDLIAADQSRFNLLASTALPAGTYRSLPALADGVVYCRRSISPKQSQIIAIKLP